MTVTDRSQAAATPKATKPPKTRTGGSGVNTNEPKPTTVVIEVRNIGFHNAAIVARTVSRMLPCLR